MSEAQKMFPKQIVNDWIFQAWISIIEQNVTMWPIMVLLCSKITLKETPHISTEFIAGWEKELYCH